MRTFSNPFSITVWSKFSKNTAPPQKSGLLFCALLALTLILASGFVNPSYAQAGEVGRKEIASAGDNLTFLSETERSSLIDSLHTGSQNELLDFSGSVGMKTFLEALQEAQWDQAEKLEIIQIYQNVLGEDLPVFFITKTGIRLLRTDAPFSTVRSTLDRQVQVLRQIETFLKREEVNLFLTYQNRIQLIDTLAESLVTYVRQDDVPDDSEISSRDIERLKRTTHNLVRYSSLPSSLSRSGVKGRGEDKGSNSRLDQFLKDQETFQELASIASRTYIEARNR
ncbi:MAG: hypothetical protein ACLFN4_05685 [Candidatus Acetothermia bacterium]